MPDEQFPQEPCAEQGVNDESPKPPNKADEHDGRSTPPKTGLESVIGDLIRMKPPVSGD